MNTNYLDKLYKIMELVFDQLKLDNTQYQLIKDEMIHAYLTKVIQKVTVNLSQEKKEEFNNIVKTDFDKLEKSKAINTFLANNIDKKLMIETVVNELEIVVKKLVHTTNTNLTGEVKEEFNQELRNILLA